jgi:hypothetical protein
VLDAVLEKEMEGVPVWVTVLVDVRVLLDVCVIVEVPVFVIVGFAVPDSVDV